MTKSSVTQTDGCRAHCRHSLSTVLLLAYSLVWLPLSFQCLFITRTHTLRGRMMGTHPTPIYSKYHKSIWQGVQSFPTITWQYCSNKTGRIQYLNMNVHCSLFSWPAQCLAFCARACVCIGRSHRMSFLFPLFCIKPPTSLCCFFFEAPCDVGVWSADRDVCIVSLCPPIQKRRTPTSTHWTFHRVTTCKDTSWTNSEEVLYFPPSLQSL